VERFPRRQVPYFCESVDFFGRDGLAVDAADDTRTLTVLWRTYTAPFADVP
jgi:hypothetical protein